MRPQHSHRKASRRSGGAAHAGPHPLQHRAVQPRQVLVHGAREPAGRGAAGVRVQARRASVVEELGGRVDVGVQHGLEVAQDVPGRLVPPCHVAAAPVVRREAGGAPEVGGVHGHEVLCAWLLRGDGGHDGLVVAEDQSVCGPVWHGGSRKAELGWEEVM